MQRLRFAGRLPPSTRQTGPSSTGSNRPGTSETMPDAPRIEIDLVSEPGQPEAEENNPLAPPAQRRRTASYQPPQQQDQQQAQQQAQQQMQLTPLERLGIDVDTDEGRTSLTEMLEMDLQGETGPRADPNPVSAPTAAVPAAAPEGAFPVFGPQDGRVQQNVERTKESDHRRKRTR